MDKREKVIKGLECCFANGGMGTCLECEYKKEYGGGCELNLHKDVMEVLKAQEETIKQLAERYSELLDEKLEGRESMKPGLGKINHDDGSVSFFLHCPFDGVALVDGDNYCRRCGRAVKWE